MSKSLDRLQLLSTFARIAERGSISAAARDLGMSQASASRQLAELEDRLGAKLIQRTTHSLSLTEAGIAALVEARALLSGWDALSEQFREDEGELVGGLKIVAPVALGQIHLVEAALKFQAEHPKVFITWLLDDASIRFAEIGCDLLIKIGRPDDDTLIVREIASVERLVVAAPGLLKDCEVQEPSDLSEMPCATLGPFEGASIPLSTQNGKTEIVSAVIALATNNIFSAHKAALMGVGYAVMPSWFVDDDIKQGALIDVLPQWRAPKLTITASFLPSHRRIKRLQGFLATMERAIAGIAGVQVTSDADNTARGTQVG